MRTHQLKAPWQIIGQSVAVGIYCEAHADDIVNRTFEVRIEFGRPKVGGHAVILIRFENKHNVLHNLSEISICLNDGALPFVSEVDCEYPSRILCFFHVRYPGFLKGSVSSRYIESEAKGNCSL
ncbi:hypothetical protein SDC9_208829 [bioreactor metagenome]|uniref:Uncharacterized protein n=1 Tax=bioreactor metagenome TaxID=1076179 RepID=A0A645JBK4_9ZZZZ